MEGGSETAAGYRSLEIWRVAMEVSQSVYELTATFPVEKRFGLTSQMRRSAVSIASNIAEGWGRGTPAQFANFLRIARGSANELETLLELSHRLGFIAEEPLITRDRQLKSFGRKSFSFLSTLEKRIVREEAGAYLPN